MEPQPKLLDFDGLIGEMMARSASRSGDGPLDAYRIDKKPWRPAVMQRGLPAIFGAEERATGLSVIIKQWVRKRGVDDRELVEIWRDEIRHLYRLASFPGARDHLAMLIEPIEEPTSYTLVLASDQRVPLATLLDRETASHWFRNARTQRNRVRLWQEARRVAQALQILHHQGLIHRNLDTWSVLTTGGSEPDFLLTGFEWSMRLTSMAAKLPKRTRRGAAVVSSFYEDWRALGRLAAEILGFPSSAKSGESYTPDVSDAATFLLAAERDVLALLLIADPLKRLDGDIVIARLDSLIALLSGQLMGSTPKLVLAIQTGRTSRLSEQIREASGRKIDLADGSAQERFVAASLEEDPRLVRLKPRVAGGPPGYRLIGRNMTYELGPLVHSRTQEASWSVALCRTTSRERPAYALIEEDISLNQWDIELTSLGEADRNFASFQGKAGRWDRLFKSDVDDGIDASQLDRTHSALLLVQIVEALTLAASIWPVRVQKRSLRGSDHIIELSTRDDAALSALSKALNLQPPATRLAAALAGGQLPSDEWKLSYEAALGMREDEHSGWRFTSYKHVRGQAPVLRFAGTTAPPIENNLFLRVGGPGHDSLVRRRLKAIKNLKEHRELLTMLSDPAGNLRSSHEPWDDEGVSTRVDRSKALALAELWKILPLYLVQGPPGVGKTKLVQELVVRRLKDERTDRLLLTAQSHSAVDHLLDKIKEELEAVDGVDMQQLLPLRCRPRDRDAGSGDWDVDIQAARVAGRFAASALVEAAPANLKLAARDLAASCAANVANDQDDDTTQIARSDRAFEALLLRSANLVFASTTARQLEQLIDEQARFDWAIVEEAGKATGVELIAPLLLSHRRLMIGDHKQLPPFNSDAMLALLSSPGRIKDAIRTGRTLIVRQFAQLGMDEALDRFCADDFDIEAITPLARDLLMMFETFIIDELGENGDASAHGMGRRLEHQHRMHPAIARVVSNAFYKGAIKTDAGAETRFAKNPSPVQSIDPTRLPNSPIVFVDMKFARDHVNMPSPESFPRWTNRKEAELCCDVLSMLQPREGEHPTLAVLSPYRAQVRLIETIIEQRQAESRLSNLDGFRQGAALCGTVDSFQGNEADVVVISLVRNNHHTAARGLGFLADAKRMNVLISRAKWRMILVGSLDFLEHRFADGEHIGDGHELAFLRKILDMIEILRKERGSDGVPLATVVTPEQLGFSE